MNLHCRTVLSDLWKSDTDYIYITVHLTVCYLRFYNYLTHVFYSIKGAWVILCSLHPNVHYWLYDILITTYLQMYITNYTILRHTYKCTLLIIWYYDIPTNVHYELYDITTYLQMYILQLSTCKIEIWGFVYQSNIMSLEGDKNFRGETIRRITLLQGL
jgi:hypothetical protein